MKKNKIRKIVLVSIVAVLVITVLYRLSIEQSDYNQAISKQINKANVLLENAKLGNDKGDYSKNTVLKMKNSIAEAEALIEEEAPDIDDLRSQYKKIKEDIKEFKASSNKNCLSKEDVEKLKKDNESFTKENALGSDSKVEWDISGSKIENSEAINLDVETDTVYEDLIKEIAKDNDMDIQILSFRHNGKLPGEADINFSTSSDGGIKHLYKYDDVSNHLIYQSELQVMDNKTLLSIKQGGDWILADKKIEVAKVDVDEVKPGVKDEAGTEEETNTGKEDNADSNNSTKKSDNKPSSTSLTTTPSNTSPSQKAKKKYCTIEIRCDTILNNMDRLPAGKDPYIPKDGVILAPTKIEIKEGENVFDILKRVTRSKGIQMEFRNDPLYSGAYIMGINHLYEFDGGELSGWMYKVNGWFPNYGCSRYIVKHRDVISWNYTCNLGKDVGDQDYDKYNKD
jgi:hypothetical protein